VVAAEVPFSRPPLEEATTTTAEGGGATGLKAYILKVDRATRRSAEIVNAGVWTDAVRRLEFNLPPGFVQNDPAYEFSLIAGHEFLLVFGD
jgi:hypothetical protein